MLKKGNRDLILEQFFHKPRLNNGGFKLRELSRVTKIAPTSVKNYLLDLENKKLIFRSSHPKYNYPIYFANRKNHYFMYLKKLHLLQLIKESGLLIHLLNHLNPQTIVLFGPASRGEDHEGSDIDLFIIINEDDFEVDSDEDDDEDDGVSNGLVDNSVDEDDDYDEEIDLPDIDKFESLLKRKLNVLFSASLHELDDDLLHDILNGIVLHGNVDVKSLILSLRDSKINDDDIGNSDSVDDSVDEDDLDDSVDNNDLDDNYEYEDDNLDDLDEEADEDDDLDLIPPKSFRSTKKTYNRQKKLGNEDNKGLYSKSFDLDPVPDN